MAWVCALISVSPSGASVTTLSAAAVGPDASAVFASRSCFSEVGLAAFLGRTGNAGCTERLPDALLLVGVVLVAVLLRSRVSVLGVVGEETCALLLDSSALVLSTLGRVDFSWPSAVCSTCPELASCC